MNKAEERALEVYPIRPVYSSMISVALKDKSDANYNTRQVYIQGYLQALADVKAEVERVKEKKQTARAPTATHKCYQGGRILGYDDVLYIVRKFNGEED
jgi:hypothetical protein